MFSVNVDVFADAEEAVVKTLLEDDGTGNMLNPVRLDSLFKIIETDGRDLQQVQNFDSAGYESKEMPACFVVCDKDAPRMDRPGTMESDYKIKTFITVVNVKSGNNAYKEMLAEQKILCGNVMRVITKQRDSMNDFSGAGAMTINDPGPWWQRGYANKLNGECVGMAVLEFMYFNVIRFQ